MNKIHEATYFFPLILSGNLSVIKNYFNSNPSFNPNITDNSNQTSLFFLFLSSKQNINYFEIMEYLLSKGTDPLIIDNNNQTVLFYSAAAGDVKCTQYLLEHYYFDINFTDKNGQTPLYYAVEHSHIDVINLLLNKGYDINHIDNNGENCLFVLNKDEQINILEFLINKGVDLNIQSKEKGKITTFYAHKGLFKLVDVIEGINNCTNAINEDVISCLIALNDNKPLSNEELAEFIHEYHDIYKELMQYQDMMSTSTKDVVMESNNALDERGSLPHSEEFLLDINKSH